MPWTKSTSAARNSDSRSGVVVGGRENSTDFKIHSKPNERSLLTNCLLAGVAILDMHLRTSDLGSFPNQLFASL
jgi:hypothetical protein